MLKGNLDPRFGQLLEVMQVLIDVRFITIEEDDCYLGVVRLEEVSDIGSPT